MCGGGTVQLGDLHSDFMRFILFFLLSFLPAIAQNKTWGGTSTSLFPNLAPNAVVFSTSGTNGLTVINGNVPTAKIKFAAPIGTPSTNDNLLIRSNDGYVHISTYTVGDLLSLGGGGNNIANTDLTWTGNRVQDMNSFSMSFVNHVGLSATGTGGTAWNDSTSVTLQSGAPFIQVTPSKVELKAVGSNGINLYSDAINASTATVGQVWTLQNATTGAGEWASGVAPAPGNVITVDTISDLLSESTGVVITQGYYSVGDGGHAAYRYVSGDLSATNTVTVFEGAAGRYFLMQSGSISAKQAGAVGDGVTDDHDALQALFTACSGLTARIDPLSYFSTSGFTLPDDIKIIARGASIAIDLNGETGVAMGSRCTVDGGEWLFSRQSGGSNGFDNSGFTFGTYTAAGSVSNSVVKNVSGNLTGYASSFVFITGGSENITIDGVEFGDSADVDDVVTTHWGYLSGAETNGTLHPHNIKIRNINVGSLTSGSADASPVFVSAGYDISVENVTSRRARHGAIMVAGDFGFTYSGFSAQTLGSVSYRNITCLQADNIGVLVQNVGTAAVVYPQEFLLESSTIFGVAGNNGGLYMNTARNFTARNCVFANHLQGTTFTGGAKNILLDRCSWTTNALQGIIIDDATTDGVDIVENYAYKNARSLSGTNAAGIKLAAGNNVRVIGCKLGDSSGTEPNQEVGIGVSADFVNATLAGNYVYGVKAGTATAYHLGSSANAPTHLWLVYDNNAAAGVTLLSSPETLPFQARGKYRDFMGTGTPTLGTFLKGDAVIFNEATSSPFAVKCSVAGSPGTFVTLY